MANISADAVASMFGGGVSAIGALTAFANSGSASSRANDISNGFANNLSSNKPPVLNGTKLANSLNSGFASNSNTSGAASFSGQIKNLIDAAYTIVSCIETTNSLLQKMIDINTGKIPVDERKLAARNNRISLFMSRTAMGRLALAAMSKSLGEQSGIMDYRVKNALNSGVTSSSEIMVARMFSKIPGFNKFFGNMNLITEKILRTKDTFTNDSNITLTKVIPAKLEAIGGYIKNISSYIDKSHSLLSYHVDNSFTFYRNVERELSKHTMILSSMKNDIHAFITRQNPQGQGNNNIANQRPNATTPNGIILLDTELIRAIDTIPNTIEKALTDDQKERNKLMNGSRKDIIDHFTQVINQQKLAHELDQKLNISTEKILEVNMKTSMMLGNVLNKLPNLITRAINTALKISFFMGIGRMIFKAMGMDNVANNITATGAMGFINSARYFISDILSKMWNSPLGVKIRESIRNAVNFIKEQTINAIVETAKTIFKIYNTFVLGPRMIRKYLWPVIVDGYSKMATNITGILAKITSLSKTHYLEQYRIIDDSYSKQKKNSIVFWKNVNRIIGAGTTGILATFAKGATKAVAFAGKLLSWVGITMIIYDALKTYIGGFFTAWKKNNLSDEAQKKMGLSEQIAMFTKDTLTFVGNLLWTGLVEFCYGFIDVLKGLLIGVGEYLYDITIGLIPGLERDKSNDQSFEKQRKQHIEETKKKEKYDAEMYKMQEETKDASLSTVDILKNGFDSMVSVLKQGVNYITKIFDIFKPKNIGGALGSFKGMMVSAYSALLGKEKGAAFRAEVDQRSSSKLKDIISIAQARNPELAKYTFDEYNRPIGVNKKEREDAAQAILNSLPSEYQFEYALQSKYLDFMHAINDEKKEDIKEVLNDENLTITKLLTEIKTNTAEEKSKTTEISLKLLDRAQSINEGKSDTFMTGTAWKSGDQRTYNAKDLIRNPAFMDDAKKEKGYKLFGDIAYQRDNTISNALDYAFIGEQNGTYSRSDLIKSIERSIASEGDSDKVFRDLLGDIRIMNSNASAIKLKNMFTPIDNKNSTQTILDAYSNMIYDFDESFNTFVDAIKSGGGSDIDTWAQKFDYKFSPEGLFNNFLFDSITRYIDTNDQFKNAYNLAAHGDPSARYALYQNLNYTLREFGYHYGARLRELRKAAGDTTSYASLNDENKNLADTIYNTSKAIMSNKNAFFDISKQLKEIGYTGPGSLDIGDGVTYGDWNSVPLTKTNDWRDSIYFAAARVGLDPELISAIIQQESSGRVNAGNVSKAYGLMQVQAAAAIDAHKFLNLPNNSFDRLTPEDNIMLGSAYMAKMIKDQNGSIINGLRAYNWGPGNFNKWYNRRGTLSEVPQEAVQYPGKVLQHYGKHYYTDPKMPIQRKLHLGIRSKAMIEAGLLAANAFMNENIMNANENISTISANSDHQSRALKYLNFRSTNMNKFMLVHPTMREAFLRYAEEMYTLTNKKVNVTSTYRTLEDQQRLWDNRGSNPNKVGKPNQYNRHHLGMAIDVSSRDGHSINDRLLTKYGLVRPYISNDPVHIEMRQWRSLSGPELVKRYGNYPATGQAYGYSGAIVSDYRDAIIPPANSIGALNNYKGLPESSGNAFIDALQLIAYAGKFSTTEAGDGNYGDAIPVNYTGITGGISNTTFDNELSKIKLAGISSAQMNKIVNGDSPLESQLTKVMGLLAKKTAENNQLMRQLFANNSTVNNVLSVNSSNSTNMASNTSSGGGRGGSNVASNNDSLSSLYGGNDMGLRALYI